MSLLESEKEIKMPKFLDVPSWYDSNGTILSAEGRYVINLTAEDFDTQSETGVARARIDISNLPYGTKGVIYSPSTALATMQYIGIRALSNQTGSLELAYSISTMPFVPYGIFFTISRQATDMNGKTIIFENATIYKNETNLVSLYPSAYSNPVIVAMNGTLGRAILVYSGVKVNSFNGDNTLESNIGFYAPTTSGTSGQYLQSNGSGAPVWKDSNFIELPKDAVSYSNSMLEIDLSSITDWSTYYYVFGTARASSSSSSSNILFYISGLVLFTSAGRLADDTAIALGFGTIGFTSNTVDAQHSYRTASTNYHLTFTFNLFTNSNYDDMTITSSSAPYSARLFAIKTSIPYLM